MNRSQNLREMLLRHEPKDARERGFREQLLVLVERGEQAFAREEFERGHFTASAFVVTPGRDMLLLILHAKLGLWLQPGGHIEPTDADVVAAAVREVREETGLVVGVPVGDGPLDLDVHEIPAFGAERAHRHFDVRFAFVAETMDVRAGSDARAAKWVRLDAMEAAETDESVCRAARRLGARLL